MKSKKKSTTNNLKEEGEITYCLGILDKVL